MTAMLTGAVVVARKTVVSAIVNQGNQVRTNGEEGNGRGRGVVNGRGWDEIGGNARRHDGDFPVG